MFFIPFIISFFFKLSKVDLTKNVCLNLLLYNRWFYSLSINYYNYVHYSNIILSKHKFDQNLRHNVITEGLFILLRTIYIVAINYACLMYCCHRSLPTFVGTPIIMLTATCCQQYRVQFTMVNTDCFQLYSLIMYHFNLKRVNNNFMM